MPDIVPWGEWRPDVSTYKGQHSPTITNAIPRGDGYGPMLGYTQLSTALSAACRGFFAAYDDDGTIALFAGTSTKLWKMSNTDYSWDDVAAGTGYSALPTGAHWQFTQFGTTVVAVNGNDDPQSYVMGSSTDFADLGGNPPNSNYATTVGPFVVLSGLTGDAYTIQWSSRNNAAEWTIGTNEGDSQTFRDGGLVRGIAGGEFGLVFQDRAIRRMTYSPGTAVIFEFDVVSRDLGLYAPYSLVQSRDMIFFLSAQGFYMWHPMTGFKAIGKERVDRTFFDDADRTRKDMIIGAADPQTSRVVWTYKSTASGINTQFDRMMCYDFELDRWSGFINIPGEYCATMANPGITLESLDSVNTSIDAHTVPFDSYPLEFGAKLAIANADHAIGLLAGDTLEVTLETSDAVGDKRSFVRGARPITDATEVYSSIGGRQRPMDAITYTTEHNVNRIGVCPHRTDNRLLRFRNRFPAGHHWHYSMGIEPYLAETGEF